ncbi:hypothetical protein ACTMTI_21130 [Nonomuraea sp. H19]|uniref:hypothetical protein n=1 Tax=Nonomuraea sp. H19 TaxID=3452206 RepID=UPI003F89B280
MDVSYTDLATAVSEFGRLSDAVRGHVTALQADLPAAEDIWGSGESGGEARTMY